VRSQVDLGALARRVAADLAPAALAKGQSWSWSAEQPLPVVSGNETLLAVLLRNLVDNAVRYSPAGAEVRVAVQRSPGGQVQLQVDDSGPGLAERPNWVGCAWILARLGERFFRVLGTNPRADGQRPGLVHRAAHRRRAPRCWTRCGAPASTSAAARSAMTRWRPTRPAQHR
jgi:two-component system sensor histidine kinase QseC